MAVAELKIESKLEDISKEIAAVQSQLHPTEDKSEILLAQMNMIAFNNKMALNLR